MTNPMMDGKERINKMVKDMTKELTPEEVENLPEEQVMGDLRALNMELAHTRPDFPWKEPTSSNSIQIIQANNAKKAREDLEKREEVKKMNPMYDDGLPRQRRPMPLQQGFGAPQQQNQQYPQGVPQQNPGYPQQQQPQNPGYPQQQQPRPQQQPLPMPGSPQPRRPMPPPQRQPQQYPDQQQQRPYPQQRPQQPPYFELRGQPQPGYQPQRQPYFEPQGQPQPGFDQYGRPIQQNQQGFGAPMQQNQGFGPSVQNQQLMPDFPAPPPPLQPQFDQFGRQLPLQPTGPMPMPPIAPQVVKKQKGIIKGLAIFVAILGLLCLAAAVYYVLM